MGHGYPLGYDYFRSRLHKAFSSQIEVRDEDAIRNGIARAEFVRKGESVRVRMIVCVLCESVSGVANTLRCRD